MVKKGENDSCNECRRKDLVIASMTKKINDFEFGKVCKKALLTEEQKKELEKKKADKKEQRENDKKQVEKMKEENRLLKVELLNRFGVNFPSV